MQCPVCGLMFAVAPETPVVELKGKRHPVCSSECARKLRSNPPKYGVAMNDPSPKRRR